MASTYQPLENVWRSRTLAPVTGTCFPSPTRRDVWSRVMKAEIKNILFFCDWRLESTWNFVIKHLWLGNSPAAYIFLWFFFFLVLLLYIGPVLLRFSGILFLYSFHSNFRSSLHLITGIRILLHYEKQIQCKSNRIQVHSLLFEDLEKYGFFFFCWSSQLLVYWTDRVNWLEFILATFEGWHENFLTRSCAEL